MSKHEWYRNKIWDVATQATFRARLSRSRSGRPQYLIIQAGFLTESYPAAALGLIDEYFETGDDFHVPSALCVRATAYKTLGKVAAALSTYKEALEWEASHPGLITTARIDLPKLVVDHRMSDEYEYALNILAARFTASDHQFPSIRYLWNGCNALISNELNHFADAREFAERALGASAQTESPFRYHRAVGLVRNTSDEFGRRLKRIVRPSKLRSFFRLMTST